MLNTFNSIVLSYIIYRYFSFYFINCVRAYQRSLLFWDLAALVATMAEA